VSYGYNPPPVTGNLQVWSQNIVTYLQRVASRLAFKSDDARASENGVILYDNVNGYPVVSKDGEWRQIVLADGYAFLGQDNDVTAAVASTAYAITYDTPPMANGISLGSPASRIVFEEGGTYLLAFSAQIASTSSSTVDFRFWPRINGTNVTGSTIRANLHQNDASFVVSRSAIFQMNAGDYLEVMWATDSTSGFLQAAAATAYAPAAPSTSLSITRIRA
jgi:hypothetical protein